MVKTDKPLETKDILWQNVKALMIYRYGKENLNKTVTDSARTDFKISLGSLQRIKKGDTATGTDILDKISGFFGLQTWQLLVPELDPTNPPVYLSKRQKEIMDNLKKSYKELIQ